MLVLLLLLLLLKVTAVAVSVSPRKLFSFSRYSNFCLDFLVMYRKGLIKKIKANFKFYDGTAWLINNCNTNIAQYFEMYDFFFSCLLAIIFCFVHL